MKEIIIKVLAETMNIEAESINESTIIKEIDGFDSLQFVMFVSELEESYSINIPIDVALDAITVGDLIASVEKK